MWDADFEPVQKGAVWSYGGPDADGWRVAGDEKAFSTCGILECPYRVGKVDTGEQGVTVIPYFDFLAGCGSRFSVFRVRIRMGR